MNQGRRPITSAKNRISRILSNYNGDQPDVFTRPGREYLKTVDVSATDRFALDQIAAERDLLPFRPARVDARWQRLTAFSVLFAKHDLDFFCWAEI